MKNDFEIEIEQTTLEVENKEIGIVPYDSLTLGELAPYSIIDHTDFRNYTYNSESQRISKDNLSSICINRLEYKYNLVSNTKVSINCSYENGKLVQTVYINDQVIEPVEIPTTKELETEITSIQHEDYSIIPLQNNVSSELGIDSSSYRCPNITLDTQPILNVDLDLLEAMPIINNDSFRNVVYTPYMSIYMGGSIIKSVGTMNKNIIGVPKKHLSCETLEPTEYELAPIYTDILDNIAIDTILDKDVPIDIQEQIVSKIVESTDCSENLKNKLLDISTSLNKNKKETNIEIDIDF